MEFKDLIERDSEGHDVLSPEKIEKVMGDLDTMVNQQRASVNKVLKINHFPFGETGVDHTLLGYITGDSELFLQTDKWGKKGIAFLTADLEYKVVAQNLYKSLNFTSNECIEAKDRDGKHFVYYKNGENYTHDELSAVEIVKVPPTPITVDGESYDVASLILYFNGEEYFLGLPTDSEGTVLRAINGVELKEIAHLCVVASEGVEESYPKINILKTLEV